MRNASDCSRRSSAVTLVSWPFLTWALESIPSRGLLEAFLTFLGSRMLVTDVVRGVVMLERGALRSDSQNNTFILRQKHSPDHLPLWTRQCDISGQ